MSLGQKYDGGLFITPQMRRILDQPGFINIDTGSGRLRNLFQKQFARFNPNKLPLFGLACMRGKYDVVKEAIDSGTAPDLSGTETPFQFGYVALAALGAQRLRLVTSDNAPMRHLDIITLLVDAGSSPDIPDISGHTALHHACTPPAGVPEVAKRLLDKGANMNVQNRYGEVPLFFPFQGGDVALVDILMAHGADLDIPDGNGDSPRKMCIVFGAEVTAAVQRWERKRRGEVAPWEEKCCEHCKAKGSGLKQCGRCHVVRYCSTECQHAHWKAHKPSCNPFCTQTTVTLKPMYDAGMSATLSRADFTRQAFGLATPTTRPFKPGHTRIEAENKSVVIKVQVPVRLDTNSPVANSPHGSLLIYTKKRDFIVHSRGIGGAKAYFAAELKNPEELVVKISEVLAEQPF